MAPTLPVMARKQPKQPWHRQERFVCITAAQRKEGRICDIGEASDDLVFEAFQAIVMLAKADEEIHFCGGLAFLADGTGL
jgi:hypothetical protein